MHTGAGIDLGLPVQRGVIAVIAHYHMAQQVSTSHATTCRTARRPSLGDGVTHGAGKPGTDVANHLEAAGFVVQHLGHVLADLLQACTARCAFSFSRAGVVDHLFAGQVFR